MGILVALIKMSFRFGFSACEGPERRSIMGQNGEKTRTSTTSSLEKTQPVKKNDFAIEMRGLITAASFGVQFFSQGTGRRPRLQTLRSCGPSQLGFLSGLSQTAQLFGSYCVLGPRRRESVPQV
jgi:hypothetical protein